MLPAMSTKLCIAQDPEADALLSNSPLALLFGMMLDQQIPMEKAFNGPLELSERMGGLDVKKIAATNPNDFAEIMSRTPAIHRFPDSMGKRLQALAQYLVENYEGDPEAIWSQGNPDGKEVLCRLKKLPGFGDQKARIFMALLGKQLNVQPDGWREAAGDYADANSRRSVADVVDSATLQQVRAFKKEAKRQAAQR
jgi:uncharacterized HhH-GPD family protein